MRWSGLSTSGYSSGWTYACGPDPALDVVRRERTPPADLERLPYVDAIRRREQEEKRHGQEDDDGREERRRLSAHERVEYLALRVRHADAPPHGSQLEEDGEGEQKAAPPRVGRSPVDVDQAPQMPDET
jgi:hypothetical protein